MKWRLLSSLSDRANLTQAEGLSEDMNSRIEAIMASSWASSTWETYGTGLLAMFEFMEAIAIPATNQVPVTPTVLKAFVVTLVGEYSASTIKNYINGVRAWHIIHGLPWYNQDIELEALCKATCTLAPATSKKPPQEPWTKAFIIKLHSQLNMNDPLDTTVYACLTMTFYSASRLGEFTQKKLKDFDARIHISPRNVHLDVHCLGYKCMVFHLPSTKAAQQDSKNVSWARQDNVTDPEAAYVNHR